MILCEHCGIGRLQRIQAPYVWQEGEMTSIVPDVPATVCDVCGQMYYDEETVFTLHILMEHSSNSVTSNRNRQKRADRSLWSAPRRN